MRAWLTVPLAVLSAVLSALGACGGDPAAPGKPLGPAAELAIVAHQGDDLLFMQPALHDAVQRGAGATIVYVTAGSGEDGAAASAADGQAGARAAYAAIAGAGLADWSCGQIDIAGHAAEHCRLDAASTSLVFLGCPDGGPDGAAADSLLHLWEAKIAKLPVAGQAGTTYDQRGLIATLAEIIDTAAPTTLRTLEISATHGDDHSDHMLAGALALLATAASTRAPAVIAYRGDNITPEPANLSPDIVERSTDILARFAACTTSCGRCGEACPADQLPAEQLGWLARSHPVGMQHPGDGVLRLPEGCVAVTAAGANASIVDCATAPTWHLGDDGALRATTGLCLDAILTGEIVATPCDTSAPGGPGGRFFLDDDGHMWSGVVPAPQADMAFAHLDCLIVAGGRPRAALCGAARAPIVQL